MRYRLADPRLGRTAKGPSKYLKLERSRPGELHQRHDERSTSVFAVNTDCWLKTSATTDQGLEHSVLHVEIDNGLSNHPSTRSSLRNNSRMDLPLDLLCC
jgi:hypothetical protein